MNRRAKKTIKLALQGGGSHGAFTWGVLDQLLEDERLHIAAVSGTSAGAMNAVALADGLARGGPAEARKCLEKFWSATSAAAQYSPIRRSIFDIFMGIGAWTHRRLIFSWITFRAFFRPMTSTR